MDDFRVLAAHRMIAGGERVGSADELKAELMEKGVVDILGLPMYRGLYETMKERELSRELAIPRSVLWGYFLGGRGINAAEPPLLEQWRAQGLDVTAAGAPKPQSGW